MRPVETGPKASSAIRFFPAAGLLLAVFLALGCGTVIDSAKLEDTVQQSLERSVHEKIKAVNCPSDQAVDPGATFSCEVIFSDQRRETATLKIRNKDADISMIGLEANK